MSRQEIDKLFEIFNNLESNLQELLSLAGFDALSIENQDAVASSYETVVSKLFREGDMEYIKAKCLQPENENAYNQLESEMPLSLRDAIRKEKEKINQENAALQINNEEEAKKFVKNNISSVEALKVANKFWHNNEQVILELLNDGASINLTQIIDEPSEEFVYACIASEDINCPNINKQSLLERLDGVSSKFASRILTSEHLSDSIKNYLLEEKQFVIDENVATNLLQNPSISKTNILARVENPSEQFLYRVISENFRNGELIKSITSKLEVPESVLYKCAFDPRLCKNDGERKLFLMQLTGSERDNNTGIREILQDFLNQSSGETMAKKKELLMQIYSKNDEILENIDIDLLDDKYVNTLGLDKISRIAIVQRIQSRLLKLKPNEYDTVMYVFNNYLNKDRPEEWEPVLGRLVNNIQDYRNLVNNIDDISNVDVEKLTQIIMSGNTFNIERVEDIDRLDQIREQFNEKRINSNDIEKMRSAIISKKYGIESRDEASRILTSFIGGLNVIKNAELKDFIQDLQVILNDTTALDDLRRMYDSCTHTRYVNDIEVTRKLKDEFGSLYNEGLANPNTLESMGSNVYKAGTDFRAIVTSIQAYSGSHDGEIQYDNYKEGWNRPKLGTTHFCTSYIGNDMLGVAEINSVCYGFSEMASSSLLLMGPRDISSSSWENEDIEVFSHGKDQYMHPDELINNTDSKYNEIDYMRYQNGKRKQPDYIMFFRRDGSKEMSEQEKRIWENTQKASKDFGDLPIVVIDIEECLTAERNKAQELLEKTRVNPSLEDIEKLYFIIRNNRMTTERWGGEFLPEIDIARLSEQRNQLKEQSVLQSQETQHTTKGNAFMASLQGSVVVSDEEFAQNVEGLTETQADVPNRNGQQLF